MLLASSIFFMAQNIASNREGSDVLEAIISSAKAQCCRVIVNANDGFKVIWWESGIEKNWQNDRVDVVGVDRVRW